MRKLKAPPPLRAAFFADCTICVDLAKTVDSEFVARHKLATANTAMGMVAGMTTGQYQELVAARAASRTEMNGGN